MAFVWNIAPEVFSFSPLPRWYGLIFASGIIGGYTIVRNMFQREGKPIELIDSLLMYIVLGTIIGMRLGHCLFYEPEIYLRDPIRIFKVWEGGYASHGGFLGVIIALMLFARRHAGITFFWLADRVAVASMFAAGSIRIANFFNSEIFGHATDVPWAVIFAQVDQVPRHPTQIYEALGYFTICALGYLTYRKTQLSTQPGRLLGIIMIGGFSWRFFVEFFKENQVAFENGMPINMGQILSLPFIALGIAFALNLHQRWRRQPEAPARSPQRKSAARRG